MITRPCRSTRCAHARSIPRERDARRRRTRSATQPTAGGPLRTVATERCQSVPVVRLAPAYVNAGPIADLPTRALSTHCHPQHTAAPPLTIGQLGISDRRRDGNRPRRLVHCRRGRVDQPCLLGASCEGACMQQTVSAPRPKLAPRRSSSNTGRQSEVRPTRIQRASKGQEAAESAQTWRGQRQVDSPSAGLRLRQ